MIKAGSQDFAVGGDWTPVASDTKYSIDGGAFANTGSTPTHEGQGIWSLALTAAECNGAVIVIAIIDASTKAVEDQALLIATYGNASAEIRMDFNDVVRAGLTSLPNVVAGADGGLPTIDSDLRVKTDVESVTASAAEKIADTTLNRDMDQVEGSAPIHSLTVAVLKAVSRIRDSSGVLQTYKTDGVSIIAQQTLTVDAASQPVTEVAVATA